MNFKYIIGLIVAVSVFSSCDKYLDVEPKGIVIPKRFEEFNAILNAEINTNCYPDHLAYASDDLYAPHTLVAPDPLANAYFWRETIDVDNDGTPAIWGPLYRQIYNTNIIINNIAAVTDASEEKKKQLLGEALAERANAHFVLVTAFTKAYDPATAANLPGIPWVTYTDVTTATPPRTTLQETMDHILADLKDAEGYLSTNRLNKTRFNKAVVQAILSRVYLYMGSFAEAKKYADLAMKEPHEIIDYNEYTYPMQDKNTELLWLRTTTYHALIFDLHYSNDLVNMFAADDLRMDVFGYFYNGLYMRLENYWGVYGIRFSELMLTQAEALAHANDLDGALKILNELRVLRIESSAYQPLVSANKAEVLNWVLSERRRELAFGSTRWMDMKRLAKLGLGTPARRQSINHEDLLSIDPATYTYTFEIPSRVLMFNPGMPKNF
ncbi:RagB/SusD family nutrient uptake outer membrane protein [Sphingobacterium yanglingense]|uniref:SusD-like starch-binding protein associating with outer membrane n=1 Tax=Sphingobacterium yanglingense TaxID=1437280 RepID=A0A4R6W8V2_9SPHI|nr:RagB/SusD family nutrient uptake outer membrane protein [Sphingobacterium yanglingense]TDQ75435.1 SusD-like starch-binding protein associating with outer membrane [Sphingobacterium yanglingense]